MQLPIDVVPGGPSTRFRWKYLVDGLDGQRQVVDCEGSLPAEVERAVERLITVAKHALVENGVLKLQVTELRAQAEALDKQKQPSPPSREPPKRAK